MKKNDIDVKRANLKLTESQSRLRRFLRQAHGPFWDKGLEKKILACNNDRLFKSHCMAPGDLLVFDAFTPGNAASKTGGTDDKQSDLVYP